MPHAVLVVLTFLSIVLDQILQACTTIGPITQPRMLRTEHMHMHAGFESDHGRSWQVTGKDQLAFYLMPTRFWQLCSGAPHHSLACTPTRRIAQHDRQRFPHRLRTRTPRISSPPSLASSSVSPFCLCGATGALLFELLRAREQDFHAWAQKTPVSSAVASWVAFFTMAPQQPSQKCPGITRGGTQPPLCWLDVLPAIQALALS